MAIDKEISGIHRQMAVATVSSGVQPPPVFNRKTGEKTVFGPRLEMLGAYGCTKAQVEAAIFVLGALIEHDVKIDKDLPNLLRMFSELRQKDAEHKRSPFPIIDE